MCAMSASRHSFVAVNNNYKCSWGSVYHFDHGQQTNRT